MSRLYSGQHSITQPLLLASIVLSILIAVPSVVLPARAVGVLYVSPTNLAPQPVGSMLTYQVKVAGMDSFSGWDVRVVTNYGILDPQSLSIAGNLFEANFSSSVIETIHCVDGSGTGCNDLVDGQGVAHSQAVSSGSFANGNGLLFTITYKVVSNGYSFLAIPPGRSYGCSAGCIFNGAAAVLHTGSVGVYGNPPPLPVANFTFSPSVALVGDNVTFDASSSGPSSPGATIVKYYWAIVNEEGGSVLDNSTSQPIFVYQFKAVDVGAEVNRTFAVTLLVKDSLGVTSQPPTIQLIPVSEVGIHKLVVNTLRAFPNNDILPGTPITISLGVLNKGTFTERGFNITVYLNGRIIKTFNSTIPILRQHVGSQSFLLPTTGLQPDSYQLVAAISTDPRENGYLTVRIIAPYQGSPIPLTIPQFAGLIIGLAVALGLVNLFVGRSRLKRRLRAMELT